MKQGLLHIKREMEFKQTWDAVQERSRKIGKLEQESNALVYEDRKRESKVKPIKELL